MMKISPEVVPCGARTPYVRTDARALGPPLAVGPFSARSFELPEPTDGLHVRTRFGQTWSPWAWLPAATAHGPDAGATEPLARPRHVSELLWARRADALQVATETPRDATGLRAHLVDTSGGPLDAVGGLAGRATGGVLGLLSSDDAPPEFGRIFEGRHGGVDAGVVGAHARGHNTGSIGVAVLGDHRSTAPSADARRAIAALLAWKYHVHGVPSEPSHRVRHGGRSYPTTCGHRDVDATSCPGVALHQQLPAIRREIHERS